MRLFKRKSRWERILDAMAAAMAKGGLRRMAKVTAGVVGGAAAATVASAAVSSIRHQNES
jgi:uncharacterized protein (DUF697 family)